MVESRKIRLRRIKLNKKVILSAVEIMVEAIGADQLVATVATRVDENSFNEREVTLKDIKDELVYLYNRVEELEQQISEEAVVEECSKE